jgi:hypothetical protein
MVHDVQAFEADSLRLCVVLHRIIGVRVSMV